MRWNQLTLRFARSWDARYSFNLHLSWPEARARQTVSANPGEASRLGLTGKDVRIPFSRLSPAIHHAPGSWLHHHHHHHHQFIITCIIIIIIITVHVPPNATKCNRRRRPVAPRPDTETFSSPVTSFPSCCLAENSNTVTTRARVLLTSHLPPGCFSHVKQGGMKLVKLVLSKEDSAETFIIERGTLSLLHCSQLWTRIPPRYSTSTTCT